MYLVNGNKKFGTLEFFQVMTEIWKKEIGILTLLNLEEYHQLVPKRNRCQRD